MRLISRQLLSKTRMKVLWIVALLGLAAPLARAQDALDVSISQFDAEILAPRAGEIMLEGEVLTWDAASKILEIRARAFSTPTNRRELGAARAKTLVVNEKTKLLGAARPLQTLTPQTKLRVVGRERAGEPFVARALFWELPAPSEIPADATLSPAVAALLPPARTAAGVSVRLLNAGFRLDEKSAMAPGFFFDAIATPGARVNLKQIVGPGSQRTMSSASTPIMVGDKREAQRWKAIYVDPRWKSVRVQFEVTAPDVPEKARGEFTTKFPIELPLPALGQKLPLKGTVKTDRGSVVEITEIATRKPQIDGNGDRLSNADGTMEIKVRSEKPEGVPDARVDFSLGNYEIEGKQWTPNSSGSVGRTNETTINMARPPARVKTMKAILMVRESAPQWILAQYFGTVEFELPIAALLKARSLPAPAPLPALSEVKAEGGVARAGAPFWNNSAWKVRLWTERTAIAGVPDNDNANVIRRLVITEATARARDGNEYKWRSSDASGNLFFAPDNAVLARDQAASEIAFYESEFKDGAPVELTAVAQERRFYSFSHEFTQIPIPPRGQTRELGENWSDESATLRRIGWTKSGSLFVICENVSLWKGPWYSFDVSSGVTTDNGHNLQRQSQTTRDPLQNETVFPTGTFALVFEAPPPSAKTLDLNYGATETKDGAKTTFRWPNLGGLLIE